MIFSDEEYNYQPVKNDHIAFRYELLDLLGAGSFGRVYKVKDYKNNTIIALKILKDA